MNALLLWASYERGRDAAGIGTRRVSKKECVSVSTKEARRVWVRDIVFPATIREE